MENKYKSYSSLIYDLSKPPGTSIDNDLQFYKNKLIDIKGKILEAGVGNGRLLIPLLKYKLDIIGIDKSKEMINFCKNNLKKNNLSTKLICANLENYVDKNKYEVIIFPNGGFNLLETREKAFKVLENFYLNLNEKGTLIIDLIYPVDFKSGSIYKNNFQINEEQNILIKNFYKEINWIDQYTINEISYFLNDQIVETQVMKLLWYGKEEFENILKNFNFKKQDILINYNIKRNLNIKTVTFIFTK